MKHFKWFQFLSHLYKLQFLKMGFNIILFNHYQQAIIDYSIIIDYSVLIIDRYDWFFSLYVD